MMNEESQICAKCLGYDYHLEEFENSYHYITTLIIIKTFLDDRLRNAFCY